MGGRDDLLTSLKAIMAARREELGEPPTPEELLAYRDGRLSPEERRQLEARIAIHPDAARALADLAAFPEVEAAPGVPDLSDEEIETRWPAFRAQLASLPGRPPVPERPLSTARRWPPAGRLAAAAVAIVAVGWAGGFLSGRASRELPEPAINVSIAELAPKRAGGERGVKAVEMGERSEALVLILGAPEGEGFSEYEAEVLDARGARIWSREGLHPTQLGTFHLSFPRGVLAPGRYRILLSGREGERKALLATYELRLHDGPAPR